MKKIFEKDYDDILERYLNHERTETIAKDYDVNTCAINWNIRKILLSKGLKPRKRVSKKKYSLDIIGKEFGCLEVIKMHGPTIDNNRWEAECLCSSCKNSFFIPPRLLRVRKNPTCGCETWERKKGKDSPVFKGLEEITGSMWHNIVRGAKARNIECRITIKYAWDLFLEQKRKCALSGVELSFGKSNYDETTASLDRIDSSKGYIIGNVQWLHKYINKMKLDHSQEYFIKLCRNVVRTHETVINKK